ARRPVELAVGPGPRWQSGYARRRIPELSRSQAGRSAVFQETGRVPALRRSPLRALAQPATKPRRRLSQARAKELGRPLGSRPGADPSDLLLQRYPHVEKPTK